MTRKLGYKGYVSSAKINGSQIPQSLQNLKIRDFANLNNINFELSITEYNFKKKNFALGSLKKLEKNLKGIIFFSIYQLPKNKIERMNFFKFFLKKNKIIYFAMEDIKLSKVEQIKEIEIIFFISKNSNKKLKTLKKLKI